MNTIAYEDFSRIELRSGTVVKAEPFPRAQKPAYKVWVDFGSDIGVKQTSAQITKHYTLEGLIGRQVMGCVNLTPRNMQVLCRSFSWSVLLMSMVLCAWQPQIPACLMARSYFKGRYFMGV